MVEKLRWPLFALLTLALRELLAAHPEWTEYAYSRGIFPWIRLFFDRFTGWLPFPAVHLLFALLLGYILKGLHYLRRGRDAPLKGRLKQGGFTVLSFISGVIALFYWLWGYNYYRIPIEKQLAIPALEISEAAVISAFEAQSILVLTLRRELQTDSAQAINKWSMTAQTTETLVKNQLKAQLPQMNLPCPGSPRARQPFWDGFLLRFGAAGIYNVFTGECNIDKGLHFLSKPYDLAHEICHGYGWADEGTCNFLAYIALRRSSAPELRYSAELEYWRILARAYRRINPEAYQAALARFPGGFKADLLDIRRQMDKYPEYFEAFRYKVYDGYLKAQGITEGMQNYDNVIRLVMAYQR